MSFVRYVTQQNDRWDLISLKHYGTPFGYARIIRANPTAPIRPVLPEGIVLAVPVIDHSTSVANEQLPPWKRT